MSSAAITSLLGVRPLHANDRAGFRALHGRADEEQFAELLAESQLAFEAEGPSPQRHVFVLHDGDRLLGTAALAGSIGLDLPRYSFRVGLVVHASSELKLFNRARTLLLGNDLTGCSELCLPTMASADTGTAPLRLLIDAMLLFAAAHRDRFADTMVVELPGIRFGSGGSPFWEGLGRHFHAGPVPPHDAFFAPAERSHLARLLPKHPLYSSFLGPQAEACIGQRALHARAAADALNAQGFRRRGQVNIFDAGPIVEGEVSDLRALRDGICATVAVDPANVADDPTQSCLVALSAPAHFAATLVRATLAGTVLMLSSDTAKALGAEAGQRARVLVQGAATDGR